MAPGMLSDHTRRGVLGAALWLAAAPGAFAAPSGKLRFKVYRNGVRVGEQVTTIVGAPGAQTVTTDARLVVKLGPVPVFRYHHHAVERWQGGRFASLETTTDSNGKHERVSARSGPAGVAIETAKRKTTAPADALPFTHWNPQVFAGAPLFNPQTGKLLKLSVSRHGPERLAPPGSPAVTATRWAVRGDAEIDDWYDASGVWVGLRGKLEDGSTLEYRR